MFYGYIDNIRTLSGLISGLLQGRSGVIELFVNNRYLSMFVQENTIHSFSCNVDLNRQKDINPQNLLIYCVAEMLENPEGFFAFYSEEPEEGISLDPPMDIEELTIQSIIVRKELDKILERLISPYATLRALSEDERLRSMNGKTLFEILITSGEHITHTVRGIEELISSGDIDIHEFTEEEKEVFKELKIDYFLSDVHLDKVNVISLLESIKRSKFSGTVRIAMRDSLVILFYKRGELNSIYPKNIDVFEFLLSPCPDAELNILEMDERLVDYISLRYLSYPHIMELSSDFMEVSKLFLGLSKYKRNALLFIEERDKSRYIIFDKGSLIAPINEVGNRFEHSTDLRFKEPFKVSLYFYREIRNIEAFMYLFLLNVVLQIIIKLSLGRLWEEVSFKLLRYSYLKLGEDNKLYLLRSLKEEEQEELLTLVGEILEDLSKEVGEQRQEEELEIHLRPFKEIFKILAIDEYIRLKNIKAS
jgi:hypothetical protein